MSLSVGCSVCLEAIAVNPVSMNCCQKVFCKSCIDMMLEYSSYCPNCRKAVREVKGNQPDGTMGYHVSQSSLPGYEGASTIVIKYTIPSGIQTAGHPNPGNRIIIVFIMTWMYIFTYRSTISWYIT